MDKKSCFALLLYSIVFISIYQDWLIQIESSILGDEFDGALTFFQALWPYYSFAHPARYLDGPSFSGIPFAYSFSDMMGGLLPFTATGLAFSSNPILIYNLIHMIFLLSIPLALYIRAREIYPAFWPAFLAGLGGFLPFFVDQRLHFQLCFLSPLILLPLFYRRISSHPASSLLILTGIFLWLASVSVHLFLFSIVYIFLYFFLDRNRFGRLRAILDAANLKNRTGRLSAVILAGMICAMGLLLLPYHYTGQHYGLSRHKIEAVAGALRVEHFWQPMQHLVHEKAASIPPVWALGLALAVFAIIKGQALIVFSALRYFIFLALLFWLCLGPMPFLLDPFPSVAPYNLLYEWVPGFDRIRATSRIACLLFIELSLLLPASLYALQKWPTARIVFGCALVAQTIHFARSMDPRPRLDLRQALASPANPALRQVRAMLDGQTIADGYSGIRVDPVIYLVRARQLCAEDIWPEERCQMVFRDGPDPGASATCHRLRKEDFQIGERVRRGQALMIAFSPAGAFCLNEKTAFHDRTITLVYRGPENFETRMRLSTPAFRDSQAPVLLYAARAPRRRGNYTLQIRETHLLLQSSVEVY
ncbi:MAG: hypothetical protein HS115_14690 [Spirochaetales bacterium]|nr:hypothetical protein [Spirochaetales bacterium]